MYAQYQAGGYNITTDTAFHNNRAANPPELREQLNELFIECKNKKNKKIIARLTGLINRYPQSPQLKNFLATAYNVQGNPLKATEINNRTLTEHPDYLFAKLGLANHYISTGKPQKVPEVLGAAMELKALYPERDLFHLAEVTGFYKTAIRYYASLKQQELAETKLALLQEIAPGHPDTDNAETFLFPLRIERSLQLWKDEVAARIEVTCVKPAPVSKQTQPPVFHHTEIKALYEYGLRIPAEKLKEIIALPRATVIADLEKILVDAVDRYLFFAELEYEEETDKFPLHAICLLGEMKSEKSLPAILHLLENNEEVLQFWFGDHLTETLWLPVYLLSQNNPELLKQFLLKPGIHTYAKIVVTEALTQTALHQPGKRKEIANIYKEVLSHFNQAGLKDNIIDSEFLGLTVGDIINCNFIELLPVVKELYDKNRVSLTINGTYPEVVEFFNKPSTINHKQAITNIFELYENILTTWAGYSDEDEDDFDDEEAFDDYEIQQPAVSVKIGRNEPCPCGSGKKYKKCCLDKLPV